MSPVHPVLPPESVMRSRALIARGWSPHQIRLAVAAGKLQRPRRGWVSTPGADPLLLHAVDRGGTLTCVTQAKRLGLWTPPHRGVHLAVTRPPSRTRSPQNMQLQSGSSSSAAARMTPAPAPAGAFSGGPDPDRYHWAAPMKLRAPDMLEDDVVNVLGYVAVCLPFEDALAVWESALRRELVDTLSLAQLPLGSRARGLLAAASPFSDSGLETYVRHRLRWLRVSIVAQAWIAGHRVDFLIGQRLVLQVDGGYHVGAQRTQDNAHDARLMLSGFTVVRVGYEQVMYRWPEVQGTLMSAIAAGKHRDRAGDDRRELPVGVSCSARDLRSPR